MDKNKKTLLLVNKADFLSPDIRKAWAQYFASKNIEFLFFSAKIEQNLLDAEAGDVQQPEDDKMTQSLGAAADKPPAAPSARNPASAAPPSDPAGSSAAEMSYDNRPVEWTDQGLPPAAKLVDRHTLVARLNDLSFKVARSNGEAERATVGMIGYPNVGKSSVINVLLGVTAKTHTKQRVAVGSTPGKTKHFQTLKLTESLTLCDCPGLVFPSFVNSKAEMVCNGCCPFTSFATT